LIHRENTASSNVDDYKYRDAFVMCCSSINVAGGDTSQEQCSKFLKVRPISTCDAFSPASVGETYSLWAGSLKTRLDMSLHPKPGYIHHIRPENRPKCKH
jgi:hypothetical protein